MSKMKYSLLFSLLAASLCFSSTVMANVNMGAGAKFAWDNYKRAVLDYSVTEMDANTGTGGMTLMDYPGPRFGGNFQVVINRRIVAMVDVDFGTFKHTVYTLPYDVDPAEPQKITQKYMRFGIGLEGKFYLKKPADQKAAPYVFLGIGKLISKAKSPYADGDLASTKMISKLASPFYLTLGFGAEFFVNESFSLGADIFGFRLETAKGSAGAGNEFDTNAYYTGDQTLMSFYMYSALTLNFTFVKEPSSETEQPQSNDVWGSGATQQNNTGWGTGGDASATGGWGTPAATPAAQQPAAPATSWGTQTPAAAPAAPANSGWGTPAAAPAPAQPVQPTPAPLPAQPKPKKKKKKAAASGSINVGGGGGAAPPPPAP